MQHDNIVKLYDYTETDDEYILFMEFCDKGDYLANKILNVLDQSLYNLRIDSYSSFE